MTNSQLTELVFQGLLPALKERYSTQEFVSLGHIIQKISALESHRQDPRQARYQKRVPHVDLPGSDFEEEADISVAEWTKGKKLV